MENLRELTLGISEVLRQPAGRRLQPQPKYERPLWGLPPAPLQDGVV